jgi:hypothetical protein
MRLFLVAQNGGALLAALAGLLLIPRIGAAGFLAAKLIYGLVPMLLYFAAAWPAFKERGVPLRHLMLTLALAPICWLPASGGKPGMIELLVLLGSLIVLSGEGPSLMRDLRRSG